MTVDDALRRLTAGLAEEGRIARAATELPKITPRYPEKRPPWEPERWSVDRWGDVVGLNGGDNPIVSTDAGGGTRSRAVAEHIALHDPASTLRRVEAIRRLLRRHEDAERDSVLSERDAGFEAGLYAALEALAGIYLEDTDETGEL